MLPQSLVILQPPTLPLQPLPSICCSYDFPFPCSPVTLSRFLLGGRQGGRGEEGGWQACFPAYRSCLVEPRTTRLTFVAEQASSAVDEITEIKTEEEGEEAERGGELNFSFAFAFLSLSRPNFL